MAYVPYRVRRKLKNGTWATFLVASQSDLCLRFTTAGAENGTVETALASLESKAVPVNLTTKQDGFITVADKRKLDGIEANANKYVHPAHTAAVSGLYKVTVDNFGHVTAVVKATASDITALGIAGSDTTYEPVTETTPGLMSAADFKKLKGIAEGATKVIVDNKMSATSTNPVQNMVVQAAIQDVVDKVNAMIKDAPEAMDTFKEISDYLATHATEYDALMAATSNKVDKVEGKGLSTNDYTAADKKKLDGIAEGANKYVHPTNTARTSGLYKITVDTYGHVTAATKVTKADITAFGIPSQDTTYNIFGAASASAAGTKGLVPAPAAGDQAKYLRGDGTWGAIAAGKQISFATSQPTDQVADDLWAEPL